MNESDPNLPALKPKRLLWFCAKCTCMIRPPGAEGMIGSDGQHFCSACAPGDSSIGPAIEALPAAKVTSTLAETRRRRPPSERQKSPVSMTLIAGAGAVLLMLLVALIALVRSGNSSDGIPQAAQTRLPAEIELKGIPDKEKPAELTLQARAAANAPVRAAIQKLTGPVKDWRPDWKYEGGGEHPEAAIGAFMGRENAWKTYPAKWTRAVNFENNKRHFLRFDVASHYKGDWLLGVYANGKEMLKDKLITGGKWEAVEINLSEFAGKDVNLELRIKAGGAQAGALGGAYWDNVQIVSQ